MADVEHEGVSALTPPEIASKAVGEGTSNANLPVGNMVMLGLLAGAYIALGGLFATTVAAGADGILPYGLTQFLSGLVFTVGLALVLVGGSQLFTGNTMTVAVAWAQREISGSQLLRSWAIVYVANFAGSLLIAGLVFLGGQYTFGDGAVGESVLSSAEGKVQLSFVEAIALGILANFLVCLAVWLSYSAKTTGDKILALLLPIWAFVAAGLEHSVANMYLVPIGLFVKDGAPDSFWASIGSDPSAYPDLTWGGFLLENLLPVTIGNIIGGSVLVGVAYWYVYLRD